MSLLLDTMSTTSTEPSTILVETTMPLLEIDKWSTPILSNRLVIRPLLLRDLEGYHTLYSQPATMVLAYIGGSEPSYDIHANLNMLIDSLRPWATSDILYGVFLKNPYKKEGEFIGHSKLSFGKDWPELSYFFLKEYWGKGYGTEAIKAFMDFWWSLPRSDTRLKVRPGLVDFKINPPNPSGVAKAKELVIATVEKGNEASKSVLLKTGFESVDGIENGEELITFRCKFPLKTPQYYREIYFKKE